MAYQLIESHKCFQGTQNVYSHCSKSTHCEMRFALFLPPITSTHKLPCLFWLSGLTCSEQNFITKAGAQRIAAELGLALVVPDTSPRGIDTWRDQDNLGSGAGFYIDATEEPWRMNYQMYTYLSQELPYFIANNFPVDKQRFAISGHSMGGHGALVIGLKNPQLFRSISAFAPIASITESPWGINALTHYLGIRGQNWYNYDPCYLLKSHPWPHGEILIDQGTNDPFLEEQLKPELLNQAAAEAKTPLNLRLQPGYDHSYYFISTFIEEHLRFHTACLLEL